MAETIMIQEDTFQAVLLPDQMARLPTKQLVRLFGILFNNDYLEDNRKSIAFLKEWIPKEFDTAKNAWSKASQEYVNKWKPVSHPRWQTPEVKAQKDLNKQLSSAVTRTRNRYNDIQKVQKCFFKAKHNHKRR